MKTGRSEKIGNRFGLDDGQSCAASGRHARRNLSTHRAELALEVSNTGFACVVGDDAPDGAIVDLDLVRLETVLVDLSRDQILARDLEFLLFAVAGQLDDLHAIEQRRMDRSELVRRGNEQHPRQIDVDLQVMIAEGLVLRGIQYLEECRGWIALTADADL